MKIVVDTMGGDYAPEEVVKGVVLALEERDLEIILLGNIETAEETKAILSTPKVFGVEYLFINGTFVLEFSSIKLILACNLSI